MSWELSFGQEIYNLYDFVLKKSVGSFQKAVPNGKTFKKINSCSRTGDLERNLRKLHPAEAVIRKRIGTQELSMQK